MFSINLVTLDSYQASPISELDLTFSDFRGSDIKHLPVIRIFGSTLSGEKTCLHVHGVFPYIYIPCTVEENRDSYAYKLASALDAAINVSFGSAMSTNQHIYKIQLVSGIPMYGYHEKEHLFFKIYFYNPAVIKRAADLLQNGAVLNQSLQPHEAHIPFILQFMIDYNLYGMSQINLKSVKYRQHSQSESQKSSESDSICFSNTQKFLPTSIGRQSICHLEVDAQAYDILNYEEVLKGLDLNPGIAAIWNNEKARRDAKGMAHPQTDLLYTGDTRIQVPTDNDIFQEGRLEKRLQIISQSDDESLSLSRTALSYPVEKEEEVHSLNASHVMNHFKPNELVEESTNQTLTNNTIQEVNMSINVDNTLETSCLDAQDMLLLDMLEELAKDNDDKKCVDDDSVLGSQSSALSKEIQEDNEGDDVENLNITCLDLDSLSSWSSFSKASSQTNVPDLENGNKNSQTNAEVVNNDESLPNLPQLDGNDDLCLLNKHDKNHEKAKKIANTKNPSISDKHIRNINALYKLDHQDLDVFDESDLSCDASVANNLQFMRYKRQFKKKDNPLNIGGKQLFFPALDGAAEFSSSDSEPEADVTIERQEKRICVYKSSGSSAKKNKIATTPKRTHDEIDEIQLNSPAKRRQINTEATQNNLSTPPKCCTPKRGALDIYRKYTPLKVIITTPKRTPNTGKKCTSPAVRGQSPKSSLTNSTSRQGRRINLLREYNVNTFPQEFPNEEENNSIVKSQPDKRNIIQDIEERSNSNSDASSCNLPLTQNFPKTSKEVRKRLSFVPANDTIPESAENPDENYYDDLPLAERIMNLSNECNADLKRATTSDNDKQIHINANDNIDDINAPSTSKLGRNDDLRDFNELDEDDSDETVVLNPKENDEINSDDNEDACNMTFTQCISNKLADGNQSFLSQSVSNITQDKTVVLVTKFNPPTKKRIIESMEMYNISRCKFQGAFFGNKVDLSKHKEMGNNKSGISDIGAFKSSLDRITGIKQWRRMKVNEFHPSGASIKTSNMKRALAGYNTLTICSLAKPPAPRDVKNWLKAKDYLMKKNSKLQKGEGSAMKPEKTTVQMANGDSRDVDKQLNAANEINTTTVDTEEKLQEGNDGNLNNMPSSQAHEETQERFISNSNDSIQSSTSSGLNPSLKKILENPLLYKNNQALQQLGISYGQIDYSMKAGSRNISNENFQNARALEIYQYLTVLSVEIHVVTRGDLLPDPEHDPIEGIFYAIYDDVPMSNSRETLEHGAIVVCPIENQRLKDIYSSNAPCSVSYVATEKDIICSLITLIRHCDPDILVGWEIETLSWGYIFQRATRIGFNNITWQFSRVPNAAPVSNVQTLDKDLNDPKVPGRIILDVWRIMRHETALLNYTFENIMYHVMHERIACPAFQTLSDWWKTPRIAIRWRVINHYVVRVLGTLRILLQLDIIGRTCEHARLIGIQFYEVFSRGSQFRVESMMLRLAKPLNYIPISPSVQQRASMRAPESLALIMEPESIFYTDPLIVLDFQSLYPSIIIAYNYCFSTCLGRIEHIGQNEPFEFGAATLRVKKKLALKLRGKVNYAPCGVAFVKREVRQGILPRMLTEILNTRLMVKESQKVHGLDNTLLQRVLDSQQLGLKLIANVTYGYTSANFSGRMPCIEIGDSVVSKGRETLERAIKIVQSTPKWGAQVVYGDTDSLFILLPGKSKEEAFKIGAEIADTVTAANPPPVKLKFEKVLLPSILQTKKRYCGYMYETVDQKQPEYLAKGIETVRRDGCPAVSKILEKSLKILFDTKDMSQVKQYVTRQFDKILRKKISVQDLTFAREFRGLRGYAATACVPALELTRRLMRKDPRAIPRTGERVRYVIVAGAPNQALIHCIRTPMEVMLNEGLTPNSTYYISKAIIPPLNRCFNLLGIDVNLWYQEMSHRQTPDKAVSLFTNIQKSTIRQFFGTTTCVACGEQTRKEICVSCLSQPAQTLTIIHEKIRWLERTNHQLTAICQSCTGYVDLPRCESLDCPVLYRIIEARRDLIQLPYLTNIINADSDV